MIKILNIIIQKIQMKKKKLLIIFILILALVFCTFAGVKITTNVQNKQMKKLNSKELFSYIVYDNQDEKNIKTLVTINSEKGIEYVECPNGRKIDGNSKNTISLDYIVEKNKDNEFKIKEIENNEVPKNLNINDESINNSTFKANVDEDINGYEVISLENNINLENYKTYYKIGKSENWIEGNKFSIIDYDCKRNNLTNDDNTLTILAKIENKDLNNIVTIEKNIPIDNTDVSNNITSSSLISAIGDNDLNNGLYNIHINDEDYSVKVYNFNENLNITSDTQFGTEEDVGNSERYAKNMIVLKVNGDINISNDTILTTYANEKGYGGPKGFFIYCTGTITNNGTISMTSKGAYAKGQNVYLWQNEDSSYEYIPAVGAKGGEKFYVEWLASGNDRAGNPGENGTQRALGGGGSGSGFNYWSGRYAVGEGGTATSYSGGSGGGAISYRTSKDAGAGSSEGGAGGFGLSSQGYWAGGGAGNPGGAGSSSSANGQNGTGGLLIINSNNFINNKTIMANGSNGGIGSYSGGASGGGSINIFYKNEYINAGNYEANGGTTTSGKRGGNGGTGSISIGSIETGTYQDDTGT